MDAKNNGMEDPPIYSSGFENVIQRVVLIGK